MAAALSMNSSAHRVDLPTVEKMITAMETRMQEKYDGMVEELKERVRKATSEKNELEKKLKEMQIVLGKACEMLELEPPVTFDEYLRGISEEAQQQAAVSNGVQVSNGNAAQEVVKDKAPAEVNVEQGSIVSSSLQQGRDAVDNVARPLISLGKQKVLFRYEKEKLGTELNAPSAKVRMFTGKYLLKMKGEDIAVRIVLVRVNPVAQGPSAICTSICFPMKPGTEEKPFYDPLTLKMVFVDAEDAEIVTKQFVVEPGNGYCSSPEASDKEHWSCEAGTYWSDDFFELGSYAHASIQARGFLRKIFADEKQQAFYMKAHVEFFSAPSKPAPPVIVNEVEELEPPYEKIELTEKMAAAIREWEKSPRARHSWHEDVDLNLDLICYGDQEGNSRLVSLCVQNLIKLEKKAPYFTMKQIMRMNDVGEMYELRALRHYQ